MLNQSGWLSGIITIMVLAAQFYLVRKPQRWMGLLLPGASFLFSIVRTVMFVQSGQLLGNLAVTIFYGLVAYNVLTILLCVVYVQRNKPIGSVLVTLVVTLLACGFVLTITTTMLAVNYIIEEDPKANIGQWYYAPIEETSAEALPLTLADLQSEQLPYRYVSAQETEGISSSHGSYIESQADDIDAPQNIVTLQYEVWESNQTDVLDGQEEKLQKTYQTRADVQYDYGTQNAYWLDEHLLLRYDNKVVLFYQAADNSLLNTPSAGTVLHDIFAPDVYSDTSISANKSEIEVANETAELPVTFACATELKPADRLRYSEMFYFKEEVPVLVEINCSYGNVSKLELYYVVKKDSKGYDKKFLGNIEIVNENKHGQLEAVLPVGDGELIIENGGSHNIMVDSVTINNQ